MLAEILEYETKRLKRLEYARKYYLAHKELAKAAGAKYYLANKEKMRAAMRSWRAANPEKIKALALAGIVRRKLNGRKNDDARYRQRHAERVRASQERYRLANLEKVKIAKQTWRLNNPEKLRAAQIRWDKNNPIKKRIHRENRRARERNAVGKLSADISQRLLALQKGKCAICGVVLSARYDLDHIVPIVLGGENSDRNMQVLCVTCNRSKGKKHPATFMRERGWLL